MVDGGEAVPTHDQTFYALEHVLVYQCPLWEIHVTFLLSEWG